MDQKRTTTTTVTSVNNRAGPKAPKRIRAAPKKPAASPKMGGGKIRNPNASQRPQADLEQYVRQQSAKEMKRLTPALLSFALPRENHPIRIGSSYGSVPTAVARLFRKTNLKPATTASYSDLPTTNNAAYVFRDPLRSFVYSFGLAVADSFIYSASATVVYSDELTTYPTYLTGFEHSGGVVSPHGDTLYLGRLGPSDQYRGILMTRNQNLSVTLPPQAGRANNLRVHLYRLEGAIWKELEFAALTQAAGGVALFTAQETGTYAFNIFCQNAGGPPPVDVVAKVDLIMTPATNAMCWAQLALPGIDTSVDDLQSIRTQSVSLMYTNTASYVHRQGQCVGLQLTRGTSWLDNIDYETISESTRAVTYDITQGMYCFLKPTQPTDMDMNVVTAETGNGEVEYFYDILPKSDYLVIQANTTDPLGQSGILFPSHHVEFLSTSQWYGLGSADLKSDELEKMFEFLSQIPQFHHNEDHLSSIWSWIKDAASSIWSGVKEVASTLAPLAPLAVPLLI